MGLFDRLFSKKNSGDTQIENVKTLETEILDLLLDWFAASGVSQDQFQESFYEPVMDIFIAKDSFKWHLENETEKTKQKLYITLAGLYLADKTVDNRYLKQFLEIFLDRNFNSYLVTDFVKGYNSEALFNEHPEIKNIFIVGSNLFQLCHAIHVKADVNFSYISGSTNFLGAQKYVANNEIFEKVFKYVCAQKFEEKVFFLLEVANHQFYRRRQADETPVNYYEKEIENALFEAVEEINADNKFKLNYEILLDYQQSLLSVEKTELWKNTDYKKRKYLKLKDFEDVQNFIKKHQKQAAEVIENLSYIFNFKYLTSDLHKLYAEVFTQLIKATDFSANNLYKLISASYSSSNYVFVMEKLITPLFEPISKKTFYEHPVVSAYEYFIYQNANNSGYEKGMDLLKEVCNSIENEEEREFTKMKYNLAISTTNVYFDRNPFYLNLDKKAQQTKIVQSIVDQLNMILPTALKSIKNVNYYGYDNDYFFTINIDGEDKKINFDVVGDINAILAEKKTGYRLLPISVISYLKDRTTKQYRVSLAFLNYSQLELLKKYVDANFSEFKEKSIYQETEFFNKNAPALYQLKPLKPKVVNNASLANKFTTDSNWSWFRDTYTSTLSSSDKWDELMAVIIECSGTKKPNKKWLTELQNEIEKFGKEQYFKELSVIMPSSLKEDFWFFDNYTTALKGIIWSCTYNMSDTAAAIVSNIVKAAYNKIPGIGPRSASMGNLGLLALATSGDDRAFGMLNMLRNKTKYQRFVKAIDKHLEIFTAHSDTDSELLADKSIPKMGFEQNTKTISVADYQVVFKLEKQKLIKVWLDEKGKETKTTPTDFKENHAKLLKEVTEEFKQINAIFKDAKLRIETYWKYNRTWTGKDWLKYIYAHPFMNQWIQGLIWTNETLKEDFIIKENELVKLDGENTKIEETDQVSLWHPVTASEENIAAWQNKVWKDKIEQPVRQAYREHYPFSKTESQMTASPRFAHHFLEVRKLMAIVNNTGWIFTYVHEDVNWPRVYIKQLDITAHIKCDYNRSDVSIPTKELLITKGDSTKISYGSKLEALKFETIPAKALSEICRDIDLFIATTSVAHNPELSEKTELLGGYREDFVMGQFSENGNSKIRKQILWQLIPLLKINSSGFEGNFFIVNGKINSYKINLGSGFVQIKNSQKHINLMPDVSKLKKKAILPIKDDETLYIILAKALFLQNDDQITDEKLLSAIKPV